jgi:hypothetical protein
MWIIMAIASPPAGDELPDAPGLIDGDPDVSIEDVGAGELLTAELAPELAPAPAPAAEHPPMSSTAAPSTG